MADKKRYNMKKHIIAYREKIDGLLSDPPDDVDWEAVQKEHLIWISFFQHERHIHLLVTLAFAVMEVVAAVGAVATGNIGILALMVLLLVLLVPYIYHYWFLENEVQEMYRQYAEMGEKG